MMRSFIGVLALLAGMLMGQEIDEATLARRVKVKEVTAIMNSIYGDAEDPNGVGYFPDKRSSFCALALEELKEPSLKAPLSDDVARVVRFVYQEAFGNAWLVRIEKRRDGYSGRAAILKLDIGKRTHHVEDKMIELSAEQMKDLENLMKPKSFWDPLSDKELWDHQFTCVDGATWTFEVRDRAKHQAIHLWSPNLLARTENRETAGTRNWKMYEAFGKAILKAGGIVPAALKVSSDG